MPPDVGKYTIVCQNIGPAVAGSAGPVPPPLAVQRPIAFSQPPSLHQVAAAAHEITMASSVSPFSRLYACAIT